MVEDKQLERLLTHLGEEAELPRTKPARAPPLPIILEDTQVDPVVEAYEGIDEPADVVSWTSEQRLGCPRCRSLRSCEKIY